MTRTPLRLRVGNDVVDLDHPRCRHRPANDPLPRRILAGGELDWFAGAGTEPDRSRRLWCLWAGKETAFKVATKVRGSSPVFRHRAFEVELVERPEEGGLVRLEGTVRWEELNVRIEGVATHQFVHLVGWGPIRPAARRPILEMGVEGCARRIPPAFLPALGEELGDAPTPEESRGVGGPLSRRARMVARARLRGHLRAGARASEERPHIEILTSGERPGRVPPRVVVDGEPRPEVDLSLSHHGRYVGWAILLPADQNPGR